MGNILGAAAKTKNKAEEQIRPEKKGETPLKMCRRAKVLLMRNTLFSPSG